MTSVLLSSTAVEIACDEAESANEAARLDHQAKMAMQMTTPKKQAEWAVYDQRAVERFQHLDDRVELLRRMASAADSHSLPLGTGVIALSEEDFLLLQAYL